MRQMVNRIFWPLYAQKMAWDTYPYMNEVNLLPHTVNASFSLQMTMALIQYGHLVRSK